MTWIIYLFSLGNHHYMFQSNTTSQKFQHHLFDQNRFLIHQWISLSSNCQHSMIVPLKLTLTLFSSVGVLVLVFIWLFSMQISYHSTNFSILSKTLTLVLAYSFFFIYNVVHFQFSVQGCKYVHRLTEIKRTGFFMRHNVFLDNRETVEDDRPAA